MKGIAVPIMEVGGKPAVYVDELYVREKARGQGLGTALFVAVVNWGRSHLATSLSLNVFIWNESAHRFYRRMGLEPYSVNYRGFL